MEKKEILSGFSTLRPLSYFGTSFKSFLGRFYNPKSGKFTGILVRDKGFTLVELVVVFAMLAILFSVLIMLINPIKQLERARDAQRQSDLKQTVQALDTYYNDNNCYPSSLTFGTSWQPYINNLPQDPDSSNGGAGYIYVTDPASSVSCPQWNVLFAKLAVSPVSASTSCPLTQVQGCDNNWAVAGYNYCVLSGQVNCMVINNYNFNSPTHGVPPTSAPTPTSISAQGPTSTPTPTNSPIPTVTPTSGPTPTLLPGECYCSACDSYSIVCFDPRPVLCNIITQPNPGGPGHYCDSNCTVPCQ